MIDTIVLTLQPDQFRIFDHDRFTPSSAGLFRPPYYGLGRSSFFKCVQNTTTKELKKHGYRPHLTIIRRMGNVGYTVTLRIEFSIPKLLFGNNFDEVSEWQFEQIITRLYDSLNNMGVVVAPDVLRSAPVSAVHYSKNIVLTDYSTPYNILKELAKINIDQRLDLNQTDFRNEGQCLKFRANSYEICLYDKRKDLQKAKTSEKRAIEKDNAIQLELFDQWKPKKPFEVLRMEIRLGKRVKIKHVLGQIHVVSNLTFSSLFKEAISQKILCFYLADIKEGYNILSYRQKSHAQLISDIKIFNPKIKIRKMLQLFGSIVLIDEMGIRGFREATKMYGPHHWNRLKNDLSFYNFPEEALSPIKVIEQSLKAFNPLRLKEFLLNNA